VSDRTLTLAMRWPMLHLDAAESDYDHLFSLTETFKAYRRPNVNVEQYSLVVVLSVIVPYSLILMTRVMMFAFFLRVSVL